MSVEVPATFLDLCQRLARECGVAGTGPSAVTSQVGLNQRLVFWVGQAWNKIQTKHRDWEFKRTSASWVTVNGQALYTPVQCGITAGQFGMWKRDTFRNYVTTVGLTSEVFMDYLEYDIWRNNYLYGALRDTRTRPMVGTIAPDKSVGLGPVPNGDYTITCDYFKAPIAMTADGSVPDGLPTQFYLAIVYRAMMSYGRFYSAAEVYQDGKIEYDKMMEEMEADRLPEITHSGSLC
jgi:hypothetical protein